jgi:hypothetical protein
LLLNGMKPPTSDPNPPPVLAGAVPAGAAGFDARLAALRGALFFFAAPRLAADLRPPLRAPARFADFAADFRLPLRFVAFALLFLRAFFAMIVLPIVAASRRS